MQIEDFSIRLRQGAGNGDPRDGLCLMQMVDWFSGADNVSDRPECTSPALCSLGIRLNDLAPSQSQRDELWPLVWQLLDSRDPAAEQKRTEHIVREVAHRIVAPLFDKKCPEFAARLRQARSMKEIRDAAAAAAAAGRAAGRASAAADMAWRAAEAAEAPAAAAAEAAASWASAAASRASAAAAERAAVAASRASAAAVWEELRAIFVEAIQLGRHGNADPVYAYRAAKLAHILEATE